MADSGRGGAVVVVRPRYRSRGLCTCGWAAKPRLFLSSAKIEALIHAARHDCEPAIPLIQPGVLMIVKRQGIADADDPLRRSGWLAFGPNSWQIVYDEIAQAPRSAVTGPDADGRMSKSKIAVGR
jgi:hypothetical protein